MVRIKTHIPPYTKRHLSLPLRLRSFSRPSSLLIICCIIFILGPQSKHHQADVSGVPFGECAGVPFGAKSRNRRSCGVWTLAEIGVMVEEAVEGVAARNGEVKSLIGSLIAKMLNEFATLWQYRAGANVVFLRSDEVGLSSMLNLYVYMYVFIESLIAKMLYEFALDHYHHQSPSSFFHPYPTIAAAP